MQNDHEQTWKRERDVSQKVVYIVYGTQYVTL